MSSVGESFDRHPRLLAPLVLWAALWLLRPVESSLVQDSAHDQGPTGGGLAVLGGLRSMVAGGSWLRTNLAWEQRDPVGTRAWLEATVAADGRPLDYWLNGARMIAYDFPAWTMDRDVPAAVRERLVRQQAEVALAWLEKAGEVHGPSAALLIERANIRLRSLKDREGAARLFRQAAEQPHAPWHAARIHAELLRDLGRPAEALAWLRQILPGLPAADPAARREVVLERIAQLEREVEPK